MKVSEMIKTYYPNYYKWETYPANKCAIIHKTTEEWGILHNMATSPITIDGFTFKRDPISAHEVHKQRCSTRCLQTQQ